jgi:HSP20 family protein
MTLVRFNSAMPELANIMNNIFDRSPLYTEAAGKPAVNIAQNEDQYVLEFAVPGYKKEDFKVEINNHVLTVSAQLNESVDNDNRFTHREFSVKPFSRVFNLNKHQVDESSVEARYENGILTLHIAKREEAKPKPARTIEVA